MTKIVIRRVAVPGKLTKAHSLEIDRLERACFSRNTDTPRRACYWWFAYDTRDYAVPIAFAGLQPFADRNSGYLCLAAVADTYRGHGLQLRLIRIREKQARQLGFSRMTSYVRYNNPWSLNNLIQCGYRAYEPAKPYGSAFSVYLQKKL